VSYHKVPAIAQQRSRETWNFFIFNLSRFSKNKWWNQHFQQMYIWRRTPRRQAPATASHGVKSLPPWGAAA
jgi:hypothetical protein